MKKAAIILAILLSLGCTLGCGNAKIAHAEDNPPKEQLDILQNEQADSQETPEASAKQKIAVTAGSETSSEEILRDDEIFDVSETEIFGGTNQAEATQLPLNTKVYGTLHDAQNMYFSFRTGPDADSAYQVTVINKTPIDIRIGFYVFDEFGSELACGYAFGNGIATTVTVEGLSVNTDYYVRLIVQNKNNSGSREEIVRFALTVRDTNAKAEGVNTTNDLLNAMIAPDGIEDLAVGTNQDDSALTPYDKTVSGELKDALGGWFAFATNGNAESSYLISVVNKAVGDLRIGFYVFDELGTEIAAEYVYTDGITKTITLDDLLPNTVYYIRLIAQNKNNAGTRTDTIGYALTIRCKDNTPEVNTATVEEVEEAVFETPFELSSTQVRFVVDQAVFIDENEAKEALAPVAEIILAHPGHLILLAGTTATYGDQYRCVELSERRAASVKDLLVNHFGVPASQLITVGLGYEDDPFVRGRDIDSNGDFVVTEAAKNRRVVVLDAESEIARQILGK